MKILVLCDQGNNRSVTIAHHLKYWGHDVIAAGLKTNSEETLMLLAKWAERIIFTERGQMMPAGNAADTDFIAETMAKCQLWDIGPDVYKRPFNPDLLKIVRLLMNEHRAEYKS